MQIRDLGQLFLSQAAGFSRPLDVHTEPGQQLIVSLSFSSRRHAIGWRIS